MNTVATGRRLRSPEYWIALIAVCLVSVFYYGIRAAAVLGLAVVTTVLVDFFCLFLQNKSYKKADLSNIAAAVIMVLMFPATVPYAVVIISTVFTVAVGIHVFGSRGNHLFPPAAVGYLFAVLCWKDEILRFPQAGNHLPLFDSEDVILQSSLSSVFNAEGMLRTDLLDLLIGAVHSPMGTGCILLLLVVLVILLVRRSVSYWSTVGFLFGMSFLAMFDRTPIWQYASVNMVLFSTVFLVGDIMAMPKGRLSVLFGSMLTGAFTFYLVVRYGLEYAPVVSVVLTYPIWYGLAEIEERIGRKLDAMELADKQRTADTDAEAIIGETEAEHETE